jgi:3D (Asp-Asp-Asp) domain-containing protein
MLSLGLLLPFGAQAFPDRAIGLLAAAAGETPAKHVVLIDGSSRYSVQTRTLTVDGFLRERGIARQADDTISSDPRGPLVDGATLVYRPAVTVRLVVDGANRSLRTSAADVRDALAAQGLRLGPHDTVMPPADSAIQADSTISVKRATSWLEGTRTPIEPPVRNTFDIGMARGTRRVIDAGAPGAKETIVEVLAPPGAIAPIRRVLATRVLRVPRAKIVAQGVADNPGLATLARRGASGTLRLANAALRMVATAYTAACGGCSGTTALGRPAGHGVVAVDPHYIPLGTHLYIPGYGHALAADTGGAIQGNRIDLGFDTHGDALRFGRRPVVVYVFK